MSLRIAMWSGPRNISTAMMRSFGSRSDTFVTDEPFYAHFLEKTGKRHPLREDVLASQESDAGKVAAWLSGPVPGGRAIWYQKQMAHHLLPGVDRTWMLGDFRHVLLVRDPRAVVTSLAARVDTVTREDTGLPQQIDLFEWLSEETGSAPTVLDAREVLTNPRHILTELCRRLGIRFEEAMLAWEPGPRDTDGVWGPSWYERVWASSGFTSYESPSADLPSGHEALVEELNELYELLARHALPAPVGDVG